jgi:hypothetical protein
VNETARYKDSLLGNRVSLTQEVCFSFLHKPLFVPIDGSVWGGSNERRIRRRILYALFVCK